MSRRRDVRVVVPAGIHDPMRPSGGNVYDLRVCEALEAAGWSVRTCEVRGDWPEAGPRARSSLAAALASAPEGSVVLVDGLVASQCPETMVPASRRLRTVVLMHMPVGAQPGRAQREPEAATVRASAAVVATSDWTRRWLLAAYGLDPRRVHVAHPGVDPAATAPGSVDGGNLLVVAAVTPWKGHDLLVQALALVADLPWQCTCVGPVTGTGEYLAALHAQIVDAGLEQRLRLAGPRSGAGLHRAYAAADLLVLPSRVETYGMVVAEALAHGLPVLAHDVGGVSEALGTGADGQRPGMLVPPGDAEALALAVRSWLDDERLRRRLRAAAAVRRSRLTGWERTADQVARVLEEVAA